MGHDTALIVALVSTGTQGREMLGTLRRLPDLEVRDVTVDDDGLSSAGRDELGARPPADLVIETTGRPEIVAAVQAYRPPGARLIAGAEAGLVSRLLGELGSAGEREAVERASYLRKASHQVKSPLASIQTSVNVLLGGYAGELPDRAREVVQKIHARCDAGLRALAKRRMLADLRLAGRDGLAPSVVPPNELLEEAVRPQAALADARGVSVSIAADPGGGSVRCDPQKTAALLSELIENAVVYSAAGDRVEVEVAATAADRVAISVRDHGIGIAARCLPRVFDEDYRADAGAAHYPDGAGLGLTVAREIADLQELALTVESEEGHGSVFTLVLPAAPPD